MTTVYTRIHINGLQSLITIAVVQSPQHLPGAGGFALGLERHVGVVVAGSRGEAVLEGPFGLESFSIFHRSLD
jgi:hypothetical protein